MPGWRKRIDARGSEQSSASREVPPELRGRRLLTQLSALVADAREDGQAPAVVHLTQTDEAALSFGADDAFGAAGSEAARAGAESFRTFLRTWMKTTVELDVVFDADETHVS